jgi:hypothetical protein
MTNRFNALIPAALALLTLVLLVPGCASSPSATETTASEPVPAQEIEPWDGDGMEIPLDGSSMEAWDRSMARVKAHTSPETYQSLESAIEYLLTYDLAVSYDKNRLIKSLDGRTGYEVLQRVRWGKPAPGKGRAEKGATDASLIDT